MAEDDKPRILILSDMWGKDRLAWLPPYIAQLKPHFKIEFKVCSELAEIDLPTFVEDDLHHEYVQWGIERAVKTLSQETTTYNALLGMSVGGTIGWKSLLRGFKTNRFYAISATRLRYEIKKPDCPIQLYFGDKDAFIPDSDWHSTLNLESTILPLDHEMYYKPEVVELVCQQIITDLDT